MESERISADRTNIVLDSEEAPEVSHSYSCDLFGYKLMMVKQLAAVQLHSLISEFFTLNELMKLAKYPKYSIWSKFLEKLRPVVSVKKSIKSKVN